MAVLRAVNTAVLAVSNRAMVPVPAVETVVRTVMALAIFTWVGMAIESVAEVIRMAAWMSAAARYIFWERVPRAAAAAGMVVVAIVASDVPVYFWVVSVRLLKMENASSKASTRALNAERKRFMSVATKLRNASLSPELALVGLMTRSHAAI